MANNIKEKRKKHLFYNQSLPVNMLEYSSENGLENMSALKVRDKVINIYFGHVLNSDNLYDFFKFYNSAVLSLLIPSSAKYAKIHPQQIEMIPQYTKI